MNVSVVCVMPPTCVFIEANVNGGIHKSDVHIYVHLRLRITRLFGNSGA